MAKVSEEFWNAIAGVAVGVDVTSQLRIIANGVERLEAERDAAVKRAGEMEAALWELRDCQNGPPLVTYEAAWNHAMELADAVLTPASPAPAVRRFRHNYAPFLIRVYDPAKGMDDMGWWELDKKPTGISLKDISNSDADTEIDADGKPVKK